MKPRLFEAVMAKPNEQRELYEQLKLKAEHPFLKRYAAVGIKEGFFSDMAGALKAACKPGLDKVEVQRLQVIATLARTYKEILVDYINYRAIEAKLAEMEEKYERLFGEKAKGVAPKKNNDAVRAS
jgi:hypothetical protein